MKRSKRYHLIRIAGILLAAVFLFGAWNLANEIMVKNAQNRNSGNTGNQETVSETWGARIEYDGKQYHQRHDVTSVLFLGIDYGTTVQTEGNVGTGGRSDTIMLFVLDDSTSTVKTLLIPRDTMVNVDLYKTNGDFAFSGFMQINMQYAFGDSPKRSCYLSKKKVSELLLGRPIDYCVSLSAEGIGQIIDSMGGISVTLTEEFDDGETVYPAGSVVELNGENAEHFIRFRDIETSGSNIARMNRHYDILQALLQKMKGTDTEKLITQMSDAAEDYMESDLDADTLKKLYTYPMEDSYIMLPGESVKGELHDEYYADEAGIKALVRDLFYEER